MQISKVEVQGMVFWRVTVRGQTRDVPYERARYKGLVQCLEDMTAPPSMIKAASKYADEVWYE